MIDGQKSIKFFGDQKQAIYLYHCNFLRSSKFVQSMLEIYWQLPRLRKDEMKSYIMSQKYMEARIDRTNRSKG